MQYTIDIDPVTLEKAQQYAEENGIELPTYMGKQLENLYREEAPLIKEREKGDFDKALNALIGVLSEDDFKKDNDDQDDFTDVILKKYYSLGWKRYL